MKAADVAPHAPRIDHAIRVIGLAAAFVACGGTTDPTPIAVDHAPPGFWQDPDAGSAVNPSVGDVVSVPGGTVRIGEWSYDPAAAAFRPKACDSGGQGSTTARVSPFRLMRLEVSFARYASCVQAGRCQSPQVDLSQAPSGTGNWDDASRANQPAAVDYFRARAYCLAFGGDLPTESQWIRATEGDDGAYGIKALTEAYVHCSLGQPSPLCAFVNGASWSYPPGDPHKSFRPLPDVGSSTADIGPYGHHDMFGSAAEWVRTYTSRPRIDCTAGLLEDDFYVPYKDPVPDAAHPLMHTVRDLWSQGLLTSPDASSTIAMDVESGTEGQAGTAQFFTGFRCAFPPTQ